VLQDGGSERLALWHRGYSEHIQSERLGRDGEARVHALYADLATRPEHSTYARKHGVHHLWHAGRRTEARALAERPDRLATELQADRLSQLLAELALVGSPLFGALRRHGALLGARPDALASVLELEGGGRGPGVRLRALRKPSEEPARPKVSLRAGDGEVLALAPSPRGDRLATASADGWVRLWDTATGVELAQRRLGHRRVLSLAFSPSGLLLACGTDDRGVVLLDAELVERECVAHEAPVWGVAWLGGDRLVTGSRAGGVKVFDLRGALLWSARAHDQIACLATSGDGRTLLLGGARGGLGVFATQGRLGVDPVTSARLAPELEVTVWAAREHGGRWVFVHHDGAVLTLVASPEDPAQLRLGAELRLPDERLYALAAVDDVFLCAGSSGRVYAVALEGGKVVLQSSLDAGVGAVNALATTDDTIWVGGSTGDVQAFSLDPLVLGSSPSPSASVEPPPSCAAYSIRADEVVLGSLDGRLRIATPPELETVCEVVAFDTSVSAVAFDQRLVAAGAKDGQLALFKRTASGLSRLGVLRGHEAAISSVRLLRGSGLVASGSRDHSLRLWSVFGARPLGVVVLDAGVREVVVSPGGASLAAVSRDGEVRVVAVSSLEDIASFRLEGELVDLHLFGGGASVREVIGGACVVRHLRFGGAAGEPVELAPVLVSGRSSAGRALGLQATEAAVYDSSGRRLVSAPLDFTHAARAGDAAEWLLLDAFGPRVVRLEDEGSNA
jgi:WD40 repeat protein